ncbi:hypothetical protein [Haliangium ochraceum]|uniref:Uncharacterized protein n=1 Tax=Haliangium ochraceum (strain DSM 14365 / JCM 11303 / SMP-2) TaxID=502025 RepID=D0LGR0_HALO1|nr:hypothetical protein [Haliangium ochraceum]ACY12806.1 hypothetical protein Hoch_0165 [Haliangium ochraceum DSM 14365]
MSTEQTRSPQSDADKHRGFSIYDDFDSFLKVGIREYYDRGWAKRRGNFIALLIASGQTAFALARDSMVEGKGTRKVAIGAAAVVALQVGLRYAVGGPLGLVLTVAAGASMVSYFIRNQKDIVRKVGIYKRVIQDTSKRYEDAQNGWRDGKYDLSERNLMLDGLMKRFLEQIDEA